MSDSQEKDFDGALGAVGKGSSTRGTAKAFGIAYSTLQDHVSGKKT